MIDISTLWDRVSAKRMAEEEAQRLADQAQTASDSLPVAEAPPLPVPLHDTPSRFSFGGFELTFPADHRFRDIETTLLHEGELIAVAMRRRDVQANQALEQLFESALQALRDRYPGLRVIRQQACLLAGNPASCLDFHFHIGAEPRHGRLVGALVPLGNGAVQQWLDLSTVIDPSRPGLSDWLVQFDGMFEHLTQR